MPACSSPSLNTGTHPFNTIIPQILSGKFHHADPLSILLMLYQRSTSAALWTLNIHQNVDVTLAQSLE